MRRRANRILMAIVLLLLCLVLMTTSIVSGIFAKYTVQKQILLTLGFESFGIKVEAYVRDDIRELVGSGYSDNSGHITVSNLWMNPGDSFEDAVTFKVTGKPTTGARITISAKIEPLSDAFTLDHESFPDIVTEDGVKETCVPMHFYANNSVVVNPYIRYSTGLAAATVTGTKIENSLISTDGYSPADGGGVYKTLPAKTEVDETYNFGFGWEKAYNKKAGDCYDEIGTWISSNQPTFTITYYITVEQT